MKPPRRNTEPPSVDADALMIELPSDNVTLPPLTVRRHQMHMRIKHFACFELQRLTEERTASLPAENVLDEASIRQGETAFAN
eukprot:179626-Prymnesium_polylepis.1